MKKKVKKNLIYLTLDDLNKLYGLDGKLLKKLKKKRKKRRKSSKNIKFDKIKDSSQMPGVQYLTNNASNSDTQFLKDQIKTIQDKQNKLLITDVQPNLVNNNKLLLDLKKDNDEMKNAINIIYKEGGQTFNYLYDSIEDLNKKNNNAGYTVNYNDNIGDFSQKSNWVDPKQVDEEKQTNSTLNTISESIKTPNIEFTENENSLFYGDNTSNVMEPITEDKLNNDDQQPEDIPEDTKEDTKEDTPFIEPQEEIISDKPPFVPPPQKRKEHGAAYKARVEHFRKLYYGEPVSEYSIRRYGKNPENIV
jgi:hypothetical protein